MGNNQSLPQRDHTSYLAISPSPFASIMKRPDRGLSDSTKLSLPNRSSSSAQSTVYCARESAATTRVEKKECDVVKSLNVQEGVGQPGCIPQVVSGHPIRSTGLSSKQQSLCGYLIRDSVVPSDQGSLQHPKRELPGSGRRICHEVNAGDANTNAVHTVEVNSNEMQSNGVKTCRNCMVSLSENSIITEGSKHHSKTDIPTNNEVNTSEADTNELNTNSMNSNEVNTSRNWVAPSHHQHCTKGFLQHTRTYTQGSDNTRHHDMNTNEMNTTEVNTNEMNTNEVNTNRNDEHHIIVQDTDTTSCHELISNGANTDRDSTASHHHHHFNNTKMFESSPDSCDTFVKHEKRSDVCILPSDVSEGELVHYRLKEGRLEELVSRDLAFQLSITESTLEEMTEADQSSGYDYHESSSEEDKLVARGSSFDQQDNTGGDKKIIRGNNLLSQSLVGTSVQQTTQGESMYGHEGRFCKGTTDTVTSKENNFNSDHLKSDSKFSSSSSLTGASNDNNLNSNNVRCNDRLLNGTSDTATSNEHDLNSLNLRCGERFPSEASLVATTKGHDLDSHLQTYSLSLRSNSVCETRSQTPQVYVDPRTGEFHSMVFGSFSGERTSLPGCSRTSLPGCSRSFSQTQECVSDPVGYSISHSDTTSFGTGSFTFSLKEVTDNSSSDFKPDDQLGVHVGRGGLFDSFRDSIHSCSIEQDPDACKAQDDQNHDESAQSNEIKELIEKQEISWTESESLGADPKACFRSRKAISSCDSCNIVTSLMAPAFGCSTGSLCQMCSNQQRSLGNDTTSFSQAASAEYKSQHSCDSWNDSLQRSAFTQTISSCFVDYDSDRCQFSISHEQQRQMKRCCKCETEVANESRGNVTHQKTETCEAATEDFGLKSKSQVSPQMLTFGDKCLTFCQNIIKSQRLAENEIHGTDTGQFNGSCAVDSTDSFLTPSKLKLTVNNVCYRNNHQCVTQADVGCNCVSRQCSQEDDYEAKAKIRRSMKCSPGARSSNSATLTNSDNGRQFRDPLGLDKSCQSDNPSWPYDDDTDTNRSDLDNSRENNHQHNTRSEGQHPGREGHKSEKNRVRQEPGKRMGNNGCVLRLQHSRSLSCDCGDPFKQNYVAYLCCAPEDLSSFGLTFHRTLESWGFRIFIAPRDLELGGPKYNNMTRWLEERCNGKIIVILSKNYEKSDECLFLTYFARTLDPDSKYRNIIPVVIDKDVEIPNVLKGLSIIKYNYDFRCGWLKKKLVNAIAA